MTMAVLPAVPEALRFVPLLNPISGSSEKKVASSTQEDPTKWIKTHVRIEILINSKKTESAKPLRLSAKP
jgi:hypothetical protein